MMRACNALDRTRAAKLEAATREARGVASVRAAYETASTLALKVFLGQITTPTM